MQESFEHERLDRGLGEIFELIAKIKMDDWTGKSCVRGKVVERLHYTVNGKIYEVDGKYVVLQPSEHERRIARILAEKYGKVVELIPKINYPPGIQTPDYLINGERFDLKSPIGKGKYLLQGLLAKRKGQAHSFVVDITYCPLDLQEITRQIDDLYRSPRTGFIDKIVLFKNSEVANVFFRKEKSRPPNQSTAFCEQDMGF